MAVEAFELGQVAAEQQGGTERYLQFLNKGTMSLGLYVLPAGAADTQSPHDEDEIYFVTGGRATVEVAGDRRAVTSGSIIFVAKHVDHRFVDIEEDLSLLVFFAPEHAG
jgi:mannose-6-phosphate isomerase-like protein (cupin superfamily)